MPAALAANGEPQHQFTKADQARARAASLRQSDFAAGWKAKTSKDDSGSNPRCSIYNPDQSDLIETGKYDSPDFTRSDGSFVSVSTGVFKTRAMARTAYDRVARPELPACFGELFLKQIKKPSSARVTSSGPLGFPKAGDRSNAYRLAVSVTTKGVTLAVTVDMVLFTKGRIDVALIFFGIGKPLPSSLEQPAVGARPVARRIVTLDDT